MLIHAEPKSQSNIVVAPHPNCKSAVHQIFLCASIKWFFVVFAFKSYAKTNKGFFSVDWNCATAYNLTNIMQLNDSFSAYFRMVISLHLSKYQAHFFLTRSNTHIYIQYIDYNAATNAANSIAFKNRFFARRLSICSV